MIKRVSFVSSAYVVIAGVFLIITFGTVYAGTLSCSITASSSCAGVVILRMSSSTNAHAEIATGTTPGYANNVICCTGVTGLSNSCGGTSQIVLRLSSTTNAHVQTSSQSGYPINTCIAGPVGGTISIGYQASACTGYDTTLASIASTSNSQIGGPSSYSIKVCGSGDTSQSIVFSISTSTVNFGSLTSSATSYASSTGQGSAIEVEAHTISASSNAPSGYVVTVQGGTLTSQQNSLNTITALGNTNTAPAIGNEQFGLRMATTTGTGLVAAPYSGTGFAYGATATTTSQVANGGNDGITTVYSIRYAANVSSLTEAGVYVTRLVYVATANF